MKPIKTNDIMQREGGGGYNSLQCSMKFLSEFGTACSPLTVTYQKVIGPKLRCLAFTLEWKAFRS